MEEGSYGIVQVKNKDRPVRLGLLNRVDPKSHPVPFCALRPAAFVLRLSKLVNCNCRYAPSGFGGFRRDSSLASQENSHGFAEGFNLEVR